MQTCIQGTLDRILERFDEEAVGAIFLVELVHHDVALFRREDVDGVVAFLVGIVRAIFFWLML